MLLYHFFLRFAILIPNVFITIPCPLDIGNQYKKVGNAHSKLLAYRIFSIFKQCKTARSIRAISYSTRKFSRKTSDFSKNRRFFIFQRQPHERLALSHISSISSFRLNAVIHVSGIFSYPYKAPARPPATAATVSVSSPRLTAFSTHSR